MNKMYSLNQQEWHQEKSNVLDELFKIGQLRIGAPFFVVDTSPINPSDFLDNEFLALVIVGIENRFENNFQLQFEASDEQINELKQLLHDWCNKRMNLERYEIFRSAPQISFITDDDIESYHE